MQKLNGNLCGISHSSVAASFLDVCGCLMGCRWPEVRSPPVQKGVRSWGALHSGPGFCYIFSERKYKVALPVCLLNIFKGDQVGIFEIVVIIFAPEYREIK